MTINLSVSVGRQSYGALSTMIKQPLTTKRARFRPQNATISKFTAVAFAALLAFCSGSSSAQTCPGPGSGPEPGSGLYPTCFVQYKPSRGDLTKCGFTEYTNLDLPRVHIYHQQHIVGDYAHHYTNDFTQTNEISGGDDNKQCIWNTGNYSEHNNTTRSFDFTEGISHVGSDFCFRSNSCTGIAGTDNVMSDGRFHDQSNEYGGEQSDGRSSSDSSSGSVATNDCCRYADYTCNPSGNDVGHAFIGTNTSITHIYNDDFYGDGAGFTPDNANTNIWPDITCVVAHRNLTHVNDPTHAESDFSSLNTTPFVASDACAFGVPNAHCTITSFTDSVHDVNSYTLSTEYTDLELSNNIGTIMPDYGDWYTPNGSPFEFYYITAYSMIDGDHVQGQWQPTYRRVFVDPDATVAEMQKMKYRFVIPDTKAGVQYSISWDVITYDFTTGKLKIRSFTDTALGTGGPDPVYKEEPEELPPYWDDSRDFFGGVVATWVDNMSVTIGNPASVSLAPGTGPGPMFSSHSGVRNGCATCGGTGFGVPFTPFGVLSAAFNMGTTTNGSAGNFRISAYSPSSALATPATLIYPTGINGVDVLRDGSGVLQQVSAPQAFANIVATNPYFYEIQFYYTSQVSGTVGGPYTLSGSPYVTWKIENPDASPTTYDRLRITETRGGNAKVYDYSFNATNSTWTLTLPGSAGQQQVGSFVVQDSDWTTLYVTNKILNAANGMEFYELNVYQRPMSFSPPAVSGGTTNRGDHNYVSQSRFLLVTNIIGTGSNPQVTTYRYWGTAYGTTEAQGPWNNSTMPPVRLITHPGGNWEYYEYSSTGVTNVYRCLGDASPPTSGGPSTATCSHTVYLDFTDTGYLRFPGSVTRSDKDKDVSYGGGWIEAPGEEGWNDSDLVSSYHTYKFYYTDGPHAGWIKSIYNPDQTVSIYTYDTATDGTKTNTVWTGAPDGDRTSFSSVIDGTKTVTVISPVGQTISTTQIDVRSGIVTARDVYGNFDAFGRAQSVTHLDGTSDQTYYNCCGIDQTIDRDGVATQYVYDDAKRQIATLRNGITTSNVLDSVGRSLKTIRIGTDNSQMTLGQWQYDDAGRLVKQTNALNGVTTYAEATDSTTGGLIRTTTNPDGGTIVESYYRDGNLKQRSGTAVHGMAYAYDVTGDYHIPLVTVETKLDASGNPTSEVVSNYSTAMGKNVRIVYSDSAGSTVQYSYNSLGQLTQETDPDGVTTLYGYNAKGEQCTNAVDMDSDNTIGPASTDRITFTTNDVVSAHSTNVLRSRTYVWATDSDDTPTLVSMSETSIEGLQSWQTRYGDGAVALTTHSQTVYDGTNRTVTVTAPDNSSTVTRYVNGELTSVTQYDSTPNQIGKTIYGYDAHRRRSTLTDARNGTTTYTYNDADLVSTVTTPNPGTSGGGAQTITTIYNNSLQPTITLQPDGVGVTNVYLSTGEIALTHGARSYPTGYSYDYAGRMKTMTNWSDFNGGSGARVTTWNYDSHRGFLSNKLYNGTNGPSYQYTLAGRLYTRTWARGTNTTYAYTPAGDLYTVTYDDGSTPSTTYTYDRLGRMKTVVRDGMTTTFAYDLANNILSESYSGGILNGLSVTNGYDSLLRRTGLGALSGSSLLTSAGYSYDNASRLQTVSAGSDSATYSYVPNSPLVAQIAFKHSGVTKMTTTKQYDYLNRLTSVASTGTPANFTYTYNNANQRTRVTMPDSYWIYQYDSLGQVTSAKKYWTDGTPVAGQQFEYNFDDIGNRNSTKTGGDQTGNNLRLAHYTNNGINQITSRDVPGYKDIIGLSVVTNTVTVNGQSTYRKGEYFRNELVITNGSAPVFTNVSVVAGGQGVSGNLLVPKTPETFTYDNDGNLMSDGLWTYTWDGENRLVSMQSVSTVTTPGKKKLDFKYDHQGRRIQKLVSTNNGTSYVGQYTNRFVYDGWNLIAEVAKNNSPIRTYLWGTDLSGTLEAAGGVGGLIEISHWGLSTTNCFVGFDGNGNVCALVDSGNGAILAGYDSGPFGECIQATGQLSKLSPMRFSTKYQDDESDFSYYGYRYLSASQGRWLSKDPVEESGGINLYGLCSGDAINHTDYLGQYEADFHFYVIYYLLRAKCFTPSLAYQIAHASQDVDDNPDTDPYLLGKRVFKGDMGAAYLLARLHFINSTPTVATKAGDSRAMVLAASHLSGWRNGAGNAVSTGWSLHTLADTWSHDGFTAYRNTTLNGAASHRDLTMASYPHIVYVGHSEFAHRADFPYLRPAKALQAAQAIYTLIPDLCGCATSLSWSTVSADLTTQFSVTASEYDRSVAASQMIQRRFNDSFNVWDFGHKYDHEFDRGN